MPAPAAAGYATALAAIKAGRSVDAELELKTLAMQYPRLNGPILNLGILYLNSARLPAAEAAFRRVIGRDPRNAVANDELGIVLRRLGKFQAAERAYQRAIAAQPDYAPAHLNLGILYDLYLGEPHKALAQYQRYLAIAGGQKQVENWVIELRRRIGAPASPVAKPKEPT
ncbi:MAG: tetratricopeptide repeat protein [Steroidobacteraceae bacterium]|nr:tetratricopeptide repeat protein [Steroidobacteraceae bacterium]